MADNGEAAAAPAAEPVAADEQAVEAASVDAEPSGVGGGGEDAEPSAQGEAAPELEAAADAGAEAASEEQPTQDTASPSALEVELEQLRAAKAKQDTTIAKLQAQAEADKRTIEKLTAQVVKMGKELMTGTEEGVPPEDGGESSEDEIPDEMPGGADEAAEENPDGPSQADVAKRKMIEDMFVSGTITEMEYDEMVERMEQEREETEHAAAQKAAWQDVLDTFNGQSCKKGVAKMELEWNSLNIAEPYSAAAVARVFQKHAGAGSDHLSMGEIGEFLAGSKPFMVEVREAFSDLFDFSGMSFVESLRTFLGNFKMPGESMLIERLMASFARRYFETNPGFVAHLTHDKIASLRTAYDTFVLENAEPKGETSVPLEKLTDLVKSLGGDYKWMKDKEIEEMACFSVAELRFCRETLGLEALEEPELAQTVQAFMCAAKAVHAARAAADAMAKEAEILGELEASEDEEAKAKLAAQATLLASSREQAQASAAERKAERDAAEVAAVLDWPLFVTLMAHKMGNDTGFVLAYSTIMLNTDAHNPRLTGQARMTKVQFIEGNRRTPDLAPLTEKFMSDLYDEIVVNEIKMENEADALVAAQDAAAAGGGGGASTPKPGLEGGRQRRRSLSDMFDVAPVATVQEQKSAFEELGQKMYDAQQRGIKGAPKKVQVGVTGMGLTIFDLKGRPVKNVLLQMMVQWTTDEKGVEIELKEGGKKIFLKTGEGDPICARLNLAEKEHNARSAA